MRTLLLALPAFLRAFVTAKVAVALEIASRRIVHVNVTRAPTLPWVQQQIREATAWGETPRFLVHDNDGIYGQYGRRVAVEKDGIRRSHRCHLDRWLDETIGSSAFRSPTAHRIRARTSSAS